MLPVIDYGGLAIVVPKINAVGGIRSDSEGRFVFDVFMTGSVEPFVLGFKTRDEAENSRTEMVDSIVQYHLVELLGPDFDVDGYLQSIEEQEKH